MMLPFPTGGLWMLLALPLYVFVGVILQRLTVADALFSSLARLFRWTGAGTSVAAFGVGALVAPMNGSVASSSAMLARLVAPRLGQLNAAAATALISASSTIGVVVPPSLVLILLPAACVLVLVLWLMVAWRQGRQFRHPETAPPVSRSQWAVFAVVTSATLVLLGGASTFSLVFRLWGTDAWITHTVLASPLSPLLTAALVLLLLVIPFGAASGFLGVTIVYLLGRAGVDPVTIAVLTGLSFLPHTFKFLYAPLVDLTLTRKRWFVMASITSALGIGLLGMVPATEAGLPWLRVLVVVGNLATAFLSMAVESLMAYNTAPGELGRTAGWFQAGNLGGGGLGGGLALVIAENTTLPWLPGVVLAVICLLSGIAIRYTTEPEPHLPRIAEDQRGVTPPNLLQAVWRAIQRVLLDLWLVARSRMGYLGLLICFLPIGSGAAGNLFPLFATEWGASANDVAATSGALSGLCFAAFTAVTLEAIGTGAAATKYSIFASLSNTPIAYMGILNSYFYDKAGSNAGLYSDAAMGVAGVGVFLLVAVVSRKLQERYAQRSGILQT